MKVTAKLADELIGKSNPTFRFCQLGHDVSKSWCALRDWIDIRTGSEFDAVQLDLLTDMVLQRLRKKFTEKAP
jgi:hypothetical protein